MSWLKADDKLHDHRKVRATLKTGPGKRRDAAAMGLWVLAATWAAGNDTDGFVPADELDRWDDDADLLAERLVAAGLWVADTLDDEVGYRFHDWRAYNPDGRAKRAAESEGGKRGNHTRWHVNEGKLDPDCPWCITPESGTRSGADSGGGIAPESSRPVPTRPDPSPSSARVTTAHPSAARLGLTDDDLDKIADKTNADRAYAARIAVDVLDRAGEPVRKPLAYVLRAIAAEPARYRFAARVTPATECPTHPGQLAKACAPCRFDHLEPSPAPRSQQAPR